MNLPPGFYKFSKGSNFNKTYHFVRVFIKDKKKYMQYDYDYPREIKPDEERWFLQDHRLIETYTKNKPIEITSPRITVEFTERGTPIKFSGRTLLVLRRMMDEFPRLFKALGGK